MADLRSQRREGAQTIRRVASSCGVPLVSDNASRQRIKDMAEAVLQCAALSRPDRDAVQDAMDSFCNSFPSGSFKPADGAAQPTAANLTTCPPRLRTHSARQRERKSQLKAREAEAMQLEP